MFFGRHDVFPGPAMIPAEPSLEELRRDPFPLRGRTAVVTGVQPPARASGTLSARRLAALGASLFFAPLRSA